MPPHIPYILTAISIPRNTLGGQLNEMDVSRTNPVDPRRRAHYNGCE
jgi:hypothetical protein